MFFPLMAPNVRDSFELICINVQFLREMICNYSGKMHYSWEKHFICIAINLNDIAFKIESFSKWLPICTFKRPGFIWSCVFDHLQTEVHYSVSFRVDLWGLFFGPLAPEENI